MLNVARSYPSPNAPLRPMVLYTMVLLAYCAGLRRSELARLDLGDVDFQSGTITIRQTKFRSEEHTSELQSLMRLSYAVFCLKKKHNYITQLRTTSHTAPHKQY